MHSIDATFREKKAVAATRRKQARRKRLAGLAGALVLAGLGVGFYLTADNWSIDGLDEDLVAVETQDDVAPDIPVYVPAVVDLAGDPMTISLGGDPNAAPKVRTLTRPAELTDPGISGEIDMLSDVMLSSSERLMTTIPSSPEDFAFFQAQRTARPSASVVPQDMEEEPHDLAPPAEDMPAAEAAAFSDPGAGWGETISDGEASLPQFQKTKIENNTTLVAVRSERERSSPTEDFVDKVLGARTLDSLAIEHRFSADDAKLAGEAMKTLLGKEQLEVGYVVAMRGLKPDPKATTFKLMQVSIYADAKYIGTMARADDGTFVAGVDPWVKEDLLHYSGFDAQTGPPRQYRLLDAIYSSAARNNVPTAVIGEAIMYLSRGQDLNAFATQGDRLVLVYSATARGEDGSSGRVLYTAVKGAQMNIECFVYRPQGSSDFSCVSEQDQVYSLTVTNGMVTPVNGGVLTSTFGPRKHPILKTVRIHKGVDWAAPVGTQIFAAFDGTIEYAGDGEGYGNVVRITHAGGRETRYAHMSRFADGLKAGQAVKAGDIIGYVGTTGLSTGPHLHFELYQGGGAIDPLQTVVAVASSGGTGDAAVELLVDRIIRVESGGNVKAKNPLSSATGLGQFLNSTWLRMMRTYRPDLVRSLSEAELLELRFEPTISREMVRHLAQEGEAYLRARGHEITAGRLYLCHFLGMEGAHIALSANDSDSVASVMGQAVMGANPFLNGYNIADLKNWAERKMLGKGAKAAPSGPVTSSVNVAKASPEFIKYKAVLAALVAGADVGASGAAAGASGAGGGAAGSAPTVTPASGGVAPPEDGAGTDADLEPEN